MAAVVGVQGSPLKGVLLNEQDSLGDKVAVAPKVRKAYTITKQRERWAEEEHKKFIEALQLYGRAWRRIEEHIGTKTAVQIRSHAQKFFSKVARDANENGSGDMKPIEIPPPRPKKKPTHPYPRKRVLSSAKETHVLGHLERSSSSVMSISEQDNRSPTSVLSTLGSDSNGQLFPTNSEGYAPSAGFTARLNDHENETPSPTNSVGGDDKHLSLGLTPAGLTNEDKSAMVLDMSSSEVLMPTLKLFGRTVVVTDSPKQSSLKDGDASHMSAPEAMAEKENQNGIFGGFPMSGTWPGGLFPMFYCLPPSHEAENLVATESRSVLLPWWAFNGSMPFPYPYTQQHLGSIVDLPQSSVQNECSGTGSNTASEGAHTVESQQGDHGNYEKQAAASMRPRTRKIDTERDVDNNARFVPYRRCASEEEVERPLIAGEAVGDIQALKLCL